MPGCNFDINPQQCTCLTSVPLFCELDNFAGMCMNDNQTIQEISRLAGLGIKTIVVGLTIGLPPESSCMPSGGCAHGGQSCMGGRCVNLAPSVLSAMVKRVVIQVGTTIASKM